MFILPIALALPVPQFASEAFRRHVEYLASDDLKGRDNGTPEGRKAADYVAERFKEAGLRPAGRDGTWFHDFEAAGALKGRNVLGLLPGRDPALAKEIIVVNAHHDGLGVHKGKVHNGADDNASGVAMILELARAFSAAPARRSLLFASFDAEEDGLVGSREFLKSDLVDVKQLAANVCFDLIGGQFLPGDEERFYVVGAESSPELLAAASRPGGPGLRPAASGAHVIEPMGPDFARSDYGSFRRWKVPFVFLSTGTPWYYHTEYDDLSRVDVAKMARIAGWVFPVLRSVADGDARPRWSPAAPALKDEAALLDDSIGRLLGPGGYVKEGSEDAGRLLKRREELKAVAAGKVEGEDAMRQIEVAMAQIFLVVSKHRPKP